VPIKIMIRDAGYFARWLPGHMMMEAVGHSEKTKGISEHTASHHKTGVMQSQRSRGANNLTTCRAQQGRTAAPMRGTGAEV